MAPVPSGVPTSEPNATVVADPVSWYRRHPPQRSLPVEGPIEAIAGYRLKDSEQMDAAWRDPTFEDEDQDEDQDADEDKDAPLAWGNYVAKNERRDKTRRKKRRNKRRGAQRGRSVGDQHVPSQQVANGRQPWRAVPTFRQVRMPTPNVLRQSAPDLINGATANVANLANDTDDAVVDNDASASACDCAVQSPRRTSSEGAGG
jgi:hypothetical protein